MLQELQEIKIADIKKGDIIRAEYHENAGILRAVEFKAPEDQYDYTYMDNVTHYLLKRERQSLPKQHGTVIAFPGLVPFIKELDHWYFIAPVPQKAQGGLTEDQVWERALRKDKTATFEVIYGGDL